MIITKSLDSRPVGIFLKVATCMCGAVWSKSITDETGSLPTSRKDTPVTTNVWGAPHENHPESESESPNSQFLLRGVPQLLDYFKS